MGISVLDKKRLKTNGQPHHEGGIAWGTGLVTLARTVDGKGSMAGKGYSYQLLCLTVWVILAAVWLLCNKYRNGGK